MTMCYGTGVSENEDYGTASVRAITNSVKQLKNIYSNFKNTPVYVITPIWRADNDRMPIIDLPFFKMYDVIKDFCKDYPNFKVINGVNLTPHLEEFFSDKYLHPNDLGFSIYTENLYNEIQKNSWLSSTVFCHFNTYDIWL